MSDTLRRYARGEIVTSMDWTADDEAINDAWILSDDLKADKARGQIGFDGEIYYSKVNPLIELTPEQEHLLRPSDAKTNVVSPPQLLLPKTDAERLADVRSELSTYFDGARGLEADPISNNAGGNF